ncbi:COG1266 Predicted metal-dependent membrane protease [Candidatus Nanopelagicaceae bacterium]
MSVGRIRVWDMKKLGDLVAVIGFSIGALLLFKVPIDIPNEDLDSTLPYMLIALSFYYFVHQYQLPSLKYFRLPELSIPSIAGLIVVCFYSYSAISSEASITLPVIPTITGLIYLFALGTGEELVSRGFVFGVLRKYGSVVAVVISSVLFGLMHLNLYTGKDWDPYMAYWHCLSAAGFGVLAAVIMIVTRSILSAIVMHSLFDWTVVFSERAEENSDGYVGQFDPLWQTIKDSFAEITFDVSIALILLAILGLSRLRFISRLPKRLEPLLLKFGLVEVS